MAFNQCVCLSYRRRRQFTNISAAPVSAKRYSALMHTKLLFPGKRSRFNERRTDANLHAFVAFRPVMAKIKYMYTTTRACTLIVNVIIEPFNRESKHVNPYTNTTKTHSLFSRVISS